MKRIVLSLGIALLALLLPAGISPVSAQNTTLKAKISFAFTVCRESLPAGTYTLKHLSNNTQTLVIQNEENRKAVDIACVNDISTSQAVSEGKLIFNRYGDQYFLTEAWWPGDTSGHALVKSEKEQALIKAFAADKAKKVERVIIKTTKPGKSN